MTVLATEACGICNGRGRVSESAACPACDGTGMSTAEESAKYRAVLTATALEAAKQRYAAAGVQAAEGWLREVERARVAAAETQARAGQVITALIEARKVQQQVNAALLEARTAAPEFAPASFPVTPPGSPVFPQSGATSDPLIIVDSILVRELDVWGVLNVAQRAGTFVNPMTSLGDMITGNAIGLGVRLPIGTVNQVLTVIGGVPTWQNAVTGFGNPMTTAGDLIFENATPAPARLAIGLANQVLTVDAGTLLPSWKPSPAGFANPMTALGDLIVGLAGGTASRLGIGAANQVLAVNGTANGLLWVTNPTGFTNPMTTSGDMIVATAGGSAIRLGVGANGQVLGVVGGVPTWQSVGAGFATLFPSNDPSGTTDDAAFTAAINSLPNGGILFLAPGAFYTKTGWVVPAQTVASPYGSTIAGNPVSVQGSGPATTLFPVGAAITGVSYHRTTTYGAQFGNPADPATGFLRDFVIDGTRATGASIGLDCGDGRGFDIDLTVQNFTGTGAIGFNLVKRLFWTEKNCLFRCQSYNNSTAVVIGNPLALTDVSQEYNFYDINMFCNSNQQGVVLSGGVNLGGCRIEIRGNMALTSSTSAQGVPTNNIAMLTLTGTGSQGGTRMYQARIFTKVEGNAGNGTGNVYPYGIYSDGNGYFREVSGQICHSLNGNGSTAGPGSVLNGAEFSFTGPISGDPALAQNTFTGAPGSQATIGTQPPFPGLGTLQQNYGPAMLVCVAGGTVSGVVVDGQATGLTTGPFYVPSGGSITVNGTVAPTTYNWVPVTQNSY